MTEVYSAQNLMNFASMLKVVVLVVWLKTSIKKAWVFPMFLLGVRKDVERPIFLRQFASKVWPISYDKVINTLITTPHSQ